METEGLSFDRISTLPENIMEHILTLMPIRDALRTSILSKKWRYSWRTMPKLVFTDDMAKVSSGGIQLKKYKLVVAIFHVLLFHNGPTIVEFSCSVGEFQMVSECDQIISYLSLGNKVKRLKINFNDLNYNLPVSFFSLQGLEDIYLTKCRFEPPLTFNGFSRLRKIVFVNVKVSAKMLQGFLSNCPLLDEVFLAGDEVGIDFVTEGNNFTFLDLCQCVPLIKTLDSSMGYMKYLSAGGMPHKLPTSLTYLKKLHLDVCLMEQNEISSALCMISSSPELMKVLIQLYDNEKLPVRQTPTNFLDLEHYSDMELDHLEILEIYSFSNLPLEMEFVKLIMAKSPVLKKVQIWLNDNLSVNEN